MKIKKLIESGTHNFTNWGIVRNGDITMLTVDDCDNMRTEIIDADEIYGDLADDIYAEIVAEADAGEYPAVRDANRHIIWDIAYDARDGYHLYIMIDMATMGYIYLASGSSQCIYRTNEDMLVGFFDIQEG